MPLVNPQTGFDPIQLNGDWSMLSLSDQYDDFLYTNVGVAAFSTNWNVNVSGGVGDIQVNVGNTANHPGIASLRSGAAGTFTVLRNSQPPTLLLPNGFWECTWLLAFPTLSTPADTYIARVGIINNSVATPTDGVFFLYSDGVNGGNWQLQCVKAGVATIVNTAIAVNAGQFYKLDAQFSSTTGAIAFTIDANPTQSISSNIPSTANTLVPGINFNKTVGATQRTISIDAFYFGFAFTSFR